MRGRVRAAGRSGDGRRETVDRGSTGAGHAGVRSGDRVGGAGRGDGAGAGARAVGEPAARGPPRGRGGHAGAGARLPGRAVLRPGLAHHGRDGRHRHAAAQARRRRLVRRRRGVGRPGAAVHQRPRLRPLRPPVRRALPAAPHRRRPRRPARRAARPRAHQHGHAGPDRPGDGRRALRADDPVPVGVRGDRAERERQRPGRGRLRARHARVPRHRAAARGGARPLLHGDRRLRPGAARHGDARPRPLRAVRGGRRCAADQTPAPMPSQCDDGPFGRGTGGQLRFDVRVPRNRRPRCGSPWPARTTRVAEARRELARLDPGPPGCSPASAPRAPRSAAGPKVVIPGNERLPSRSSGASRTSPTSPRSRATCEIRWTNQGKEWTSEGALARMRWVGAGFPDYPWLFGTDGEYTAHALVALGQFTRVKDHMRALHEISELLSDGSGVLVHEAVADGSIWYGKDLRGTNPATGEAEYDFNTDEIVKFPGAVALIWRWTGDDAFRDEMLDFTRRKLRVRADPARRRRRRLAGGQRERRAARHGRGEARQRRLLHPRPVRPRRHGATRPARRRDAGVGARAGRRARRALRGRRGGSRPSSSTPTRCDDPGNDAGQPEALDRRRPDGGRALPRRRARPGLASYAHGSRALADARERLLQRRAPGNRGLFHTGCGGGPEGTGESRSSRSTPPSRPSARATTGASAPGSSALPHANAETQFAQPTTGGTPDEQPGAMPEIMPRSRRRRRSARRRTSTAAGRAGRCSCRPGATTAPRGRSSTSSSACGPHLGRGRLEMVPQVPDGQTQRRGRDIRLGDGSADVLAARDGAPLHDDGPTRAGPVRDAADRPHAAARRRRGVGHARRRAGPSYDARETNRGLEVRVAATPAGATRSSSPPRGRRR